jgi:DNA-dependent RNA polymerase
MWHNVHRESLSGLSVRPRAPGVPLDAGGSSFRPQVPRRCRASIHDNFDCFASPAERFRQIIREQFVKPYAEHDVLAEVLAEAHRDVGGQKLPCVPEAGGLDIRQVLAAEYAFT